VGGHLVCMRKKRKNTRFWWDSQKQRDYYEDLNIDGTLILKRILREI
jgi:hypothetical protein